MSGCNSIWLNCIGALSTIVDFRFPIVDFRFPMNQEQMGSLEAAISALAAEVHGSAAPGTPPPPPITLRLYLDDRANAAFAPSTETRQSVADVVVDSYEIDLRLTAMRRALVAHQATNNLLSRVGVIDLPERLIDAIERAELMGIVGAREARTLRFINTEANAAKHGRGLPF